MTDTMNEPAGLTRKPNIVYVFADQWRRQAAGFRGEDEVMTPNIDAFAAESLVFNHAVSCTPLCSPHRAALMTGTYPQTSGVYTNCKLGADIQLRESDMCIGDALKQSGYATGYIGKWHLDLPEQNVAERPESGAAGWDAYTPPGPKRHGFDFWYSYGTYDEHMTPHYWRDSPEMIQIRQWSVEHETDMALDYLEQRARRREEPFVLFVSWNPPHSPFDQVPDRYKRIYEGRTVKFRPNVRAEGLAAHTGEPFEDGIERLTEYMNDYCAAVTGIDEQFGRLLQKLKELGLADDTLVVLSSDHGELMGAHGLMAKHSWHEESIGIPCLMRWPGHIAAGETDLLFNSVDIMPTLLGLAGLAIPETVEGTDCSGPILGRGGDAPSAAFICTFPGRKDAIEQFAAQGLDNKRYGWRGVRTARYTYVVHRGYSAVDPSFCLRLLYDLQEDPYQMNPLKLQRASQHPVAERLEGQLREWLEAAGDAFIIA
ncbi:Arylsulfatase [Paenibacillus konkukensis]|uniref:Arylsulfatase n=1 Tax=Paenibacillus konkukensis TaxID=2020716 RepID=A0ABY4RXT7_9BACL|nr:sulfatase [Paenibacillus konkukensis]UQZ86600.1 Arylsulfatase [Paenibacillus konkukensis]